MLSVLQRHNRASWRRRQSATTSWRSPTLEARIQALARLRVQTLSTRCHVKMATSSTSFSTLRARSRKSRGMETCWEASQLIKTSATMQTLCRDPGCNSALTRVTSAPTFLAPVFLSFRSKRKSRSWRRRSRNATSASWASSRRSTGSRSALTSSTRESSVESPITRRPAPPATLTAWAPTRVRRPHQLRTQVQITAR